MLLQSGLARSMWAEAAYNAVKTLNLSPHSALQQTVPYQLWNERKPDISHLHMFGETCFPTIMPKDQISKLHPRATKAIFVGYDEVKKAYRCYDESTKSIILTPSVTFTKNVEWPTIKYLRFGDNHEDEPVGHYDEDYSPDSDSEDIEVTGHDPVNGLETVATPISSRSDVMREYIPPSNVTLEETQVATYQQGKQEYFPSDFHPSARYLNKPINSEVTAENIIIGRRKRSSNKVLSTTQILPPNTYREIKGREDQKEWYGALEEEMKGLIANEFAFLVPPPTDKTQILYSRTTFVRKQDGSYKARICAADKREPYEEKIYAPVAADASFKLFCAVSAKLGLNARQWDVKQAFLHAKVERDVFMKQAPGTVDPKRPHWVWKLNKSLYGLKEAALLWYKELSKTLLEQGFVKSPGDNCLFAKFTKSSILLINLHVDDFAISHNNFPEYEKLRKILDEKYGLKDGP